MYRMCYCRHVYTDTCCPSQFHFCAHSCVCASEVWMCCAGALRTSSHYLGSTYMIQAQHGTLILIKLTSIAGREVWRKSQGVVRRLIVYIEPIVFGNSCLPVERLQINPKNIAATTGQRVNVVISQPKLAVCTTEAVLVVGPVEEEVDRNRQCVAGRPEACTTMNVQCGGSSDDRAE